MPSHLAYLARGLSYIFHELDMPDDIYICVCVCALNLYVGRIRKKAIEWHFIIYLNKSDMKINLIRCKNSDENLGKQRKAPSSQLKQVMTPLQLNIQDIN
jgi:hypothetical protein